jgi:ribosome-associated protein
MIAQVTDITLEVEAREYLARREEQNRILTARLQAKTDRLAAELRSAAAYVESILPSNLDGPVCVTSRYLPSRELGGDCFDYRWVDDDHLIAYVIDVSGQLVITDCFVIASANNERQVNAIVDEAEEKMRLAGYKPARREGAREGRWVLLDYVDIVVHIQHTDERNFYALDRLWRDCPLVEVSVDDVNTDDAETGEQS